MRIKTTRHINSYNYIEQVTVKEGKACICFNIYKDTPPMREKWLGNTIELFPDITLDPVDTRDEIIEQIEKIAKEYFDYLKKKNSGGVKA